MDTQSFEFPKWLQNRIGYTIIQVSVMTVYPSSVTDHFYNPWPVFRFNRSLYCKTPSHGFLIDIYFVHLFSQDWCGAIVEFRMRGWGGSLPTHHCLTVPLQGLLVDRFGQEVGRLFRSVDVVDGDLPLSHVIVEVVQSRRMDTQSFQKLEWLCIQSGFGFL